MTWRPYRADRLEAEVLAQRGPAGADPRAHPSPARRWRRRTRGQPAQAAKGGLPSLSVPARQELERLLAGDDWEGLERFVAGGHPLPFGPGPEDMASARAFERALFARDRAELSPTGSRRTG